MWTVELVWGYWLTDLDSGLLSFVGAFLWREELDGPYQYSRGEHEILPGVLLCGILLYLGQMEPPTCFSQGQGPGQATHRLVQLLCRS